MDRWMTFFKERFPLPVLLLISVGIALAGVTYGGGPIQVLQAILACSISFLFFSTLRLMDEIKDFEKDKVVHPTRPLPRGLIALSEIQKAMLGSVAAMGLLTGLTYLTGPMISAHMFAFTVVYLWLMYKEFYIGEALQKSPILYAVSHQIILLPLCAGAVLSQHPEIDLVSALLKPGLIILGGFFTYEIYRKLDPAAHALQATYRQVYGLRTTGLFSFLTLAVAGVGSYLAYGCAWQSIVLWSVEALTFLTYVAFVQKKFKLVEAAASVSLLAHIWLPTLSHFFRG